MGEIRHVINVYRFETLLTMEYTVMMVGGFPWGLRFQGGRETGRPITVAKVGQQIPLSWPCSRTQKTI